MCTFKHDKFNTAFSTSPPSPECRRPHLLLVDLSLHLDSPSFCELKQHGPLRGLLHPVLFPHSFDIRYSSVHVVCQRGDHDPGASVPIRLNSMEHTKQEEQVDVSAVTPYRQPGLRPQQNTSTYGLGMKTLKYPIILNPSSMVTSHKHFAHLVHRLLKITLRAIDGSLDRARDVVLRHVGEPCLFDRVCQELIAFLVGTPGLHRLPMVFAGNSDVEE